jgi:hypothetical protein
MTLNMFYKLLVPLLVVGITVGVLWMIPGHAVEAKVRNEREWESESESEYERRETALSNVIESPQYTERPPVSHTRSSSFLWIQLRGMLSRTANAV